MELLKDIDDQIKFGTGTRFRLFGVHRLDAMKLAEDFGDPQKKEADFFDFILVDTTLLLKDSFALVNITPCKSGLIYALFENTPTIHYLTAGYLKEKFREVEDRFFVSQSD